MSVIIVYINRENLFIKVEAITFGDHSRTKIHNSFAFRLPVSNHGFISNKDGIPVPQRHMFLCESHKVEP